MYMSLMPDARSLSTDPDNPVSSSVQNGRFLGEFQGKLYAALDKSVYLLSSVPLKEQVSILSVKHRYSLSKT